MRVKRRLVLCVCRKICVGAMSGFFINDFVVRIYVIGISMRLKGLGTTLPWHLVGPEQYMATMRAYIPLQ